MQIFWITADLVKKHGRYDNNNIFLLQKNSITYKNSLIINHYFSTL